MTREEAIRLLDLNREYLKNANNIGLKDDIEALDMAIKAYDFAEWVAREIFDEDWEYNKDAFDELACRKLAKLGIVRAKGDEWVLMESESK